ncbi:hypothetical protein [Paenibacillus oleatilyticus]|uniref:hypothetical protein n=1 Tax=Paenibacillus oleatilyticus TaxID=2594886 RepID=UPI001C20021D|nr:hypothetical protein [Paenibacillus oleatilyticus]MBU7316043.1 hypothetical protein [Paenibacillus oleatilyticus]
MERRSCKAIIEWDKDPSHFPVNEWLRDIVVNFGKIENNRFYGDTWTVLVKVNKLIYDTWNTEADVAFIVDEAPWHLLETGFSFKLWAGRDIATVRIL